MALPATLESVGALSQRCQPSVVHLEPDGKPRRPASALWVTTISIAFCCCCRSSSSEATSRPTRDRGCRSARRTAAVAAAGSARAPSPPAASRRPRAGPADGRRDATAPPARSARAPGRRLGLGRSARSPPASAPARSRGRCTAAAGSDPERRSRSPCCGRRRAALPATRTDRDHRALTRPDVGGSSAPRM